MNVQATQHTKETYLVLGMGISGKATASFLKHHKADFFVWDDSVAVREHAAQNFDVFQPCHWTHITHIILSPTVPMSSENEHLYVREGKARGCYFLTDINILQKWYPHHTYVGITGTNGKSTVTALTAHMLTALGIYAIPAGNIGLPVLDQALCYEASSKAHEKVPPVWVLELSSFQLERSMPLRLEVGALTNLTPDHLDMHGTFEAYAAAKERIFLACTHSVRGDTYDDSLLKEIDAALQTPHPFLKGEHNVKNICTTFAILKCLKVWQERDMPAPVIEALHRFKGLAHRQEIVRTAPFLIVNDSKATSVEAARTALLAFCKNDSSLYFNGPHVHTIAKKQGTQTHAPPLIWLCGGQPKGDDINALSTFFPHIKKVIVYGKARNVFQKALALHCIDVEGYASFQEAVYSALDACAPCHATLLFSPACASFDQFKNFEERGACFKRYVTAYFAQNAKQLLGGTNKDSQLLLAQRHP